MKKDNALARQKQEKVVDITAQLTKDETLESLEETINFVRQEYGEYEVTPKMREELQNELEVDAEIAKGWKKVTDILDHIDLCELAKKHPEAIGKIGRGVASIIGFFVGPVGTVANKVPHKITAKVVEFAGFLTPEHILNIIAKSQIKRARKKKLREWKETQRFDNFASQQPEIIEESNQKIVPSEEQSQAAETTKTQNNTTPEPVGSLGKIKEARTLLDAGTITQEEFLEIKAKLIAEL